MNSVDALALFLMALGFLIVLIGYVDPSIANLFEGFIPEYPSNNPIVEEHNLAYLAGAITVLLGFLIYYANRPLKNSHQP